MKVKALIVVLLCGLLGVFLQSTVLKLFAPNSIVVPNLVLIVVGFLAFHEVSAFGTVLAFLLGLQMDLASGELLGPWAASFVAVFGMLSSLSQRLFVDSPLAAFLAVFFASLLASFVYLVLVLQFHSSGASHYAFSFLILVEAIITAVCAPLVFRWLRRLLLPRSRGN